MRRGCPTDALDSLSLCWENDIQTPPATSPKNNPTAFYFAV